MIFVRSLITILIIAIALAFIYYFQDELYSPVENQVSCLLLTGNPIVEVRYPSKYFSTYSASDQIRLVSIIDKKNLGDNSIPVLIVETRILYLKTVDELIADSIKQNMGPVYSSKTQFNGYQAAHAHAEDKSGSYDYYKIPFDVGVVHVSRYSKTDRTQEEQLAEDSVFSSLKFFVLKTSSDWEEIKKSDWSYILASA